MFKNLTIKAKIVSLLSTMIILVTVSVTITWASQIGQLLHDQMKERLQNNAQIVTLILDTIKTSNIGLLETIAALPQVHEAILGGCAEDAVIILSKLYYGMKTEDRLIFYDNFLIFNSSLEQVAAAHPGTPDTSFVYDNFDLNWAQPGRVWVSDVDISMGWMQLWYVMPIFSENELMGAAAISANARGFFNFLYGDREYYAYHTNITDAGGTILFSNRIAYVGRNADDLGMAAPLAHTTMNSMFGHVSAITGLEQLAYISQEPILGWYIISFVDMQMVDNITWIILTSMVPILLGIIVAAVLIFFILSRALRPLERLRTAAVQIADGNMDVDFKIRNNDEISQVSLSFIEIIKQIQQSKLEAESASKAKSSFLSNMSHEIRTPMNAVIGMTAIAKSTNDLPKIHDSLDKIDKASNHLLGILNKILDMSKIEANQFELYPQSFEFAKMIDGVASVLSVLSDEKEQELKTGIGPEIPRYIIGDELRLAQVITNLMSNAIKFTPKGGRVSLDAERHGEDMLKVVVTDTGIGISQEDLEHLFEAFVQTEATAILKMGGTGLGLTISKFIIEQMGGEITVESAPGEGTRFTLFFPLVEGEAKRTQSTEDGEADFSGRTALVAEDVEINREIIMALLEPTGLQFVCAENGEEAVKAFIDSPELFDIVFMDIQMPVMDGIHAALMLRELDKDIPIIAMTANVFQEDIDAYLEAGMNGHLAKPLQVGDVLDTLREWLT